MHTTKQQVILSGENKGKSVNVQILSIDEVKALRSGQRVLLYTGYFGRSRLNGIIHVKINGAPKTWKTRPNDVTVPIKYGLYEYARVEYADGAMCDDNLYFVKEEFEL